MSHEKKMSWSDLEDDLSFDVSSSSYTESGDGRYWRYLRFHGLFILNFVHIGYSSTKLNTISIIA